MEGHKELEAQTIVKVLTYFVFLLAVINVFFALDKVLVFFVIFLLVLSIYLENRGFYPPRFILAILSILTLFFILRSLSFENIVEKGISALSVLTAIKFLEKKKLRDYLEIYALILVILAARALISLELTFLFQVIGIFFLLCSSCIFLTFQKEMATFPLCPSEIKKILFSSAFIFTFSILLGFLIFFILPRTDQPLFQYLAKQKKAKTGLSASITLGDEAEISEDYSVAFRVKMDKIPDEELYFRHLVLDYFDGKSWERKNKRTLKGEVKTEGKTILQTVIFSGDKPHYLLAVGKPVRFLSEKTKAFDDYSFLSLDFRMKSKKYEVISELTPFIREKISDRYYYLQTPDVIPKSIRSLAKKITDKANSDTEKIKRVYDFLLGGEYKYSLDELPTGNNPIEKFLFEAKKGNCEFFSSAFVLILRIAGVPSRIVTGFRGGEYNDIGKYYIVRQKNAHAWAEAYIEGKGWVRIDPTPKEPKFEKKGGRFLYLQISNVFDLLNYYLHNFFFSYDLEKQIHFFISLTELKPERLFRGLRLVLFPLVFFTSLFILRKCMTSPPPPEKKIVKLFVKRMEKLGYKRKKSEGLEEFLKRISEEHIREKAKIVVSVLQETIYRDLTLTKEKQKEITNLIRSLRS